MSLGAPPPGMDEYQRLMAERAGAQKRKRTIFLVVAVAVVGGGGFLYKKDLDNSFDKVEKDVTDALK